MGIFDFISLKGQGSSCSFFLLIFVFFITRSISFELHDCFYTINISHFKDLGRFRFGNGAHLIVVNSSSRYLVKYGIKNNHEFIDQIMASYFFNFLHENKNSNNYLTRPIYPRNGYYVNFTSWTEGKTNKINTKILGIVRPFLKSFLPIRSILSKFAPDKGKSKIIWGEGNGIQKWTSSRKKGYLRALKRILSRTEPQSIADYFIDHYIAGGGDFHSGNWGFVKLSDRFVIAKVDHDVVFKDYKNISGGESDLEFNRYAFDIPSDILDIQTLYEYCAKDGNFFMPGPSYQGLKSKPFSRRYSGQGNVGFFNGIYYETNFKKGVKGIDMRNYVKKNHLEHAINRILEIGKAGLVNSMRRKSSSIFNILNSSQERKRIPLVKEGKDVFGSYIDGRVKFVEGRFDRLEGIKNYRT